MSFARGLALAALAASSLVGLSNRYGEGIDAAQKFLTATNDLEGLIARRMSSGRSHYLGHKGQTAKKVDRQRRRNQMRRLTHQQQRRAG
jgi:hypothetical protein